MIFLILGFGLMDCMLPIAWAICLDIGGKYAGAVSGAMNSAGNLGGFVCSILFGYIVQRSGQYSPAIITVGILVMVSAILFACIDPEKKIEHIPYIKIKKEELLWKSLNAGKKKVN